MSSSYGVGSNVHLMALQRKGVAQMARIEESVEIKRPPDKVFAYTTDARTWTKWQSTFPEAEQTSQGPV